MTDIPISDNEGPQFDREQDDLTKRLDQYDAELSHYAKWETESRDSYAMVAGRQWDQKDIDAMQDSNRLAVTFNRIETTIDAVSGAEIMGRQEVTYLPRTIEDSGVTDVLSQGAQYVRQNCDAEDEESDAFRDCLICGVGVTQTRPDYSEEEDGQIVIERVDPLEILFDPTSSKANYADARFLRRKKRMSRDAVIALFGEDDGPSYGGDDDNDSGEPIIDNPRDQYATGDQVENSDDVIVCEYQWFEEEAYHRVSTPAGNLELDEMGLDQAAEEDPTIYDRAVRQTRRKYRRAFRVMGRIKDPQDIKVNAFTYCAITGKRDRNEKVYYGLVRPMKDPQRYSNKFRSSMLHQYVNSSKGGVMMEKGAVDDIREFEDSWAKNDAVTFVPDGSLSNMGGARIQQKPISQMSPALPAMIADSDNAIRDVTGVNLEILGMADRQQAGVLEHQRKQAAYGILSAFFNSARRYRKIQGRLLLSEMREYLPPDMLVRIVGDDGQARYVPMAYQDDTMKYDVIVDEAPTSPNQKERVFAILSQFQGMIAESSPEIMAELIKYSPLPAAVSEKLAKLLNPPPAPPSPEEQMQQGLMVAGAQQEVRKVAAEAGNKEADTALKVSETRKTDAEAARDLTEALRQEAEAELMNTVANIGGQAGVSGA